MLKDKVDIHQNKEFLSEELSDYKSNFYIYVEELEKSLSIKLDSLQALKNKIDTKYEECCIFFGEESKTKLEIFLGYINSFVKKYKEVLDKIQAEEADELRKEIKKAKKNESNKFEKDLKKIRKTVMRKTIARKTVLKSMAQNNPPINIHINNNYINLNKYKETIKESKEFMKEKEHKVKNSGENVNFRITGHKMLKIKDGKNKDGIVTKGNLKINKFTDFHGHDTIDSPMEDFVSSNNLFDFLNFK